MADSSAKSRGARIGSRLRALRRQRGVTQAALARELGISPSYLNLVEHERRPVSAELLLAVARRFDVDLRQLGADADRPLLGELMQAFGDPLFDDFDVPAHEVREIVTVAPTACRAFAHLYQGYLETRSSAQTLADRLSADLSLPGVDRSRLPTEQVSTFIQQQQNHFPELELAAERLWERHSLASDDLLHDLVRLLDTELGIRVRVLRATDEGGAVRRYEPESRVLSLSESLPAGTRAFQIAHQIALLTERDVIDRLAQSPGLTTDESRTLARVILANYFAGAVLMPYEPFRQAALEHRYDVELLENRFGATFEMVCHRLTTLSRAGASGIPLHFLRVDIAGNISKWFSGSGFPLPRYGGSCPRLNLHTAFLTPGLITVQLSRTADGRAWFSIARTIARASRGYHVPRSVQAVLVGCAVEHARGMVYADRIDLDNRDAAVPIGTTCRLCHQPDCQQRVHPPLEQPLRIRENERGHSFFNPLRPAERDR